MKLDTVVVRQGRDKLFNTSVTLVLRSKHCIIINFKCYFNHVHLRILSISMDQ